jgi:ParB family chromosome partitioning protein
MARHPDYRNCTLDIAEVHVGPRCRAIDPVRVVALMESIRLIGLKTPITVRFADMPDEDGVLGTTPILIAGAHRLEAMRQLGETKIDAVRDEDDEVEARLWEISENLHRAELLPVERAEHIDEWRRLTVERGSQAATPLGGRQPHDKGIVRTADALGVSEDTVRRAAKIVALPQATRDTARTEGWSQDKLLQATRPAKPAPLPPEPLNDFEAINKQVAAMMSAWNRAAPEAREKFLEQIDRPVMDRRFA